MPLTNEVSSSLFRSVNQFSVTQWWRCTCGVLQDLEHALRTFEEFASAGYLFRSVNQFAVTQWWR